MSVSPSNDKMAQASFPDDMVNDAELFTTEFWAYVTRNWDPATKFIAFLARARTYEERQARAKDLFNNFKSDPEDVEVIVSIWSLSDEALDRLIACFPEKESAEFRRRLLE